MDYKPPMKGRDKGHVTRIIFWGSIISLEWVKLGTSNLVCRLVLNT